jgi:gamma-glutamyltranspeptidase/glutathione hydrolase
MVDAVQRAGGVLTAADLAAYRVVERPPLDGAWHGLRVYGMPLPSSGGIAVLEALGILDATGVDLAPLGAGSPAARHITVEALKHAFADRARWLGDPGSARRNERELLVPERLRRIGERINRFAVGRHDRYGGTSWGGARARGQAPLDASGTSHLCVIDGAGNAVALTTTVNGYFGAHVVGPRSGVVLNNQIDDFSLGAGMPNQFGLVQADANLVAPGKRPLSSMSPTLVLDDRGVVACLGGSGGPRIISNVVQVLLDVFVFGRDVGAAVEAPRVHHQWTPDRLRAEPTVDAWTLALLRARGHVIDPLTTITAVQAVVVRADGAREAASDPRKGGAPAAEPARAERNR